MKRGNSIVRYSLIAAQVLVALFSLVFFILIDLFQIGGRILPDVFWLGGILFIATVWAFLLRSRRARAAVLALFLLAILGHRIWTQARLANPMACASLFAKPVSALVQNISGDPFGLRREHAGMLDAGYNLGTYYCVSARFHANYAGRIASNLSVEQRATLVDEIYGQIPGEVTMEVSGMVGGELAEPVADPMKWQALRIYTLVEGVRRASAAGEAERVRSEKLLALYERSTSKGKDARMDEARVKLYHALYNENLPEPLATYYSRVARQFPEDRSPAGN